MSKASRKRRRRTINRLHGWLRAIGCDELILQSIRVPAHWQVLHASTHWRVSVKRNLVYALGNNQFQPAVAFDLTPNKALVALAKFLSDKELLLDNVPLCPAPRFLCDESPRE